MTRRMTSSSSKPSRAPSPVPVATGARVRVGDVLVLERRYVVDGALTSVTDKGRFRGIELVGSAEHIVLEPSRGKGAVRMIPLHSISEITVQAAGRRGRASPVADAFDPSVA